MSSRSWLLVAVMVVCACVAIGCSIYVLSGGTGARFVIAGLGLSIGLSILCIALMQGLHQGDLNSVRHSVRSDIASFDRRLRDDHNRSEHLAHDMAELRELSNRNAGTIAKGFAELKEGYAVLNEQLRTTVQTVTNFQQARSFVAQRNMPGQIAGQFGGQFTGQAAKVAAASYDVGHDVGRRDSAGAHEPVVADTEAPRAKHVTGFENSMNYTAFQPDDEPVAAASQSPLDQLVISLEPIIDLFSSKTAHYRLHLAMAKPEGGEVAQDVLLHHADRTGLRPEFDVYAAREALKLLGRLRQRDEGLSIFMAIGPSTLQSESALNRIIADMHVHDDIADGLVFELPHAMLAGLSDTGLEGLAKLARAGVYLSLANVAVSGIDLAPLATLNVRYLTLSAVTAGGLEGPSPQLISFAQSARASRIQTIITGVVDRRVVQKLTKVSRFASGPVFAEPRRVKTGLQPDAQQGIGAAA
jgi:EAL domain-containing protein (putative c-di-GMP-specific phosphodiesterase class I)